MAWDVVFLDEVSEWWATLSHDQQDARTAQVVRLRYFAGLSVADTALALDVSERTVKNEWAFARAWLTRELGAERRD